MPPATQLTTCTGWSKRAVGLPPARNSLIVAPSVTTGAGIDTVLVSRAPVSHDSHQGLRAVTVTETEAPAETAVGSRSVPRSSASGIVRPPTCAVVAPIVVPGPLNESDASPD